MITREAVDQSLSKPSDVLTDEYFVVLNELLRTAEPMGCFCLGTLSRMAVGAGVCPSRDLLVAASKCRSIEEGDEVFAKWLAKKHLAWSQHLRASRG